MRSQQILDVHLSAGQDALLQTTGRDYQSISLQPFLITASQHHLAPRQNNFPLQPLKCQ